MTREIRATPFLPEYRQCCRKIIIAAIEKPEMMYGTLSELMYLLMGHSMAYQELGLLNSDDSFESQFREWIFTNYNVSCSMGWADACENVSTGTTRPSAIFEKWVLDFLDYWIDSSIPS